MSTLPNRGTPEGDKDEETFNTKKRPAQEKENSLSKKRNQPKREESNPALKEKIHNMNNSTLSDLAARNLMDTNKPETKRDEVPSKRPAFDDEMLVVCCALEITPQEKTTMRNMRCFDTVDRTIKACNLIIRRHQLDERLSAWTWSKLLRFSKWRAKNQDAAINEFYSIMLDNYNEYLGNGRKLDDDILYITRKRLQSPTGGIMQGKVFTVIDLQKIERPAFGYEYDLTDDLCGNILSYAADGNIVSRLCELQLISHKWYNIVMSETCSSESWDMAFRQKFPGLFEGPRMHTRKDCMNLTFGYNHQAWVIQRAIGRFARVNDRMNMLQSWTAQFWRESMDPCIICGVRWSKLSTERCEYSRCPFQQFLHEYGCNNKHYREKEAYHTRLFVCKTCGMRHPDKAMRTVGESTVLCVICAEDPDSRKWCGPL